MQMLLLFFLCCPSCYWKKPGIFMDMNVFCHEGKSIGPIQWSRNAFKFVWFYELLFLSVFSFYILMTIYSY